MSLIFYAFNTIFKKCEQKIFPTGYYYTLTKAHSTQTSKDRKQHHQNQIALLRQIKNIKGKKQHQNSLPQHHRELRNNMGK